MLDKDEEPRDVCQDVRWSLVATVLMLALPLADAESIAGDFSSHRAEISGDVQGSASMAALLLHPLHAPANAPVEFMAEGTAIHLRTRQIEGGLDGEPSVVSPQAPEEVVKTFPINGRVVVEPGPAAHVRLLAREVTGQFESPISGSFLAVDNGPDLLEQVEDPRGDWVEAFRRPAWPIGPTAMLRSAMNATTIDGPSYVYIYGATVRLPSGETLQLGAITQQTPGAPAGALHAVHDYLVVDAQHVEFAWGQAPAILARAAQLHVEGATRFVEADGTLVVDGNSTPRNRQLVVLNGSFDLALRSGPQGQQWNIAGQVDYLAIDAQDRVVPRLSNAIVVGGALALLGAIAAWLTVVFGRSNAFDHETRMALLQYIRDEPAITRMELARKLNVGRSTARHHLNRLTREGLVAALEAGKNPAYILNAAVTLEGLTDAEAIRCALAVLGHETRRAILNAAAQPTDYESFALARPISRAGFSMQCQILQEAGLLDRQQNGKRIAWQARTPLSEIRARLTAAFEQRHGPLVPATPTPIATPAEKVSGYRPQIMSTQA